MAKDVIGTIYLCHFERRYRHAGHYLGFSEHLDKRDALHRAGDGARLLQVLKEHGIGWEIVRTWEGVTRNDERRMKRQGGKARLCPHEDCKEIRRQRRKRWPKKYRRKQ